MGTVTLVRSMGAESYYISRPTDHDYDDHYYIQIRMAADVKLSLSIVWQDGIQLKPRRKQATFYDRRRFFGDDMAFSSLAASLPSGGGKVRPPGRLTAGGLRHAGISLSFKKL